MEESAHRFDAYLPHRLIGIKMFAPIVQHFDRNFALEAMMRAPLIADAAAYPLHKFPINWHTPPRGDRQVCIQERIQGSAAF